MIIYYKNSLLASIVSILGCAFAFAGIAAIIEEEIAGGICIIIIAIPFIIWGKIISKNKAFKQWWKQIVYAGLAPQIAQDINTAVEVYNKYPDKRTLKKIAELNPAAAERISSSIQK